MPIGPMMINLDGLELTAEEKILLKHPMVGSVIFFAKNFSTPDQLRALIKSIREIRPEILLAIDHEGGLVQRFQRRGFRTWPALRVYGDVYKMNRDLGLKMAREYAEEMGRELASYSIDINLAPVLDLHTESNVIGALDRAFSAKPEEVIELGAAFINGLSAAGVTAVGKHVPGHGICLGDSHVIKPESDIDLKKLCETHFLPFIELTTKGKLNALMPAHITYTKIDPNNVVSFSDKWLKGIIREKCGEKVALISDCLAMEGANVGTFPERSLRALNAGLDMIIICHQPRKLLLEVADTLLEKYTQSDASKKRLLSLAGTFEKKSLQWLSELQKEKKLTQDQVGVGGNQPVGNQSAGNPQGGNSNQQAGKSDQILKADQTEKSVQPVANTSVLTEVISEGTKSAGNMSATNIKKV